MSETSTLIEKLGLDKDAIYKCVRRADCSNCLCDDVRYSKCQLITPWGKFSREYPSLMALLLERLSEKMGDKDKTERRKRVASEVTAKPECGLREKTICDEISELKIEESVKERIISKVSELERQNKLFVSKLNDYYHSTQRLKQAIVMLSVMAAEKDERVKESQVY